MGRPPCCDKSNVKRGLWTPEEDAKILAHVSLHGIGNWTLVPKKAGLNRCGKSCRLRWTNYLRPDLKHDNFTSDEEELIIRLHEAIGSRWSIIARQLPGRTDNDVKNYWNTKLKKKLQKIGIDPITHKPISKIINDFGNISGNYQSSSSSPSPFVRNKSLNNLIILKPQPPPKCMPKNNNNGNFSSTWDYSASNQFMNQDYNYYSSSASASSSSSSTTPYLSSSPRNSFSSSCHQYQQPPQADPSSQTLTWKEFLVSDPVLEFQRPTSSAANLSEGIGCLERENHVGNDGDGDDDDDDDEGGRSFVEDILDKDREMMMSQFPQLLDPSSFDY